MGRFGCCWCLFILLVLVVIVTNTGNAKKNSEQKRQKKGQIKSSEGKENTARNKQQSVKKKGETKPFEKKTEGRKKMKKNKNTRKKKLRAKDEEAGDYSTSFDPNWACSRNQARNYCFGSGFAGHDVGTCTCEAREVKKVKSCNSCVRQQVLKHYGNQPWHHPDAEGLSAKMNVAVTEAFRKSGPDAVREHLEWERTTAIKPEVSCGTAAGKLRATSWEKERPAPGRSKGTGRERERAAPGRSEGTTRGREGAAPRTTSGEDRLKSRYQEEDDTGTCSRLSDHGHGTCGAP